MAPKMQYGTLNRATPAPFCVGEPQCVIIVRLGNSGLKVSKIILGCMSYGSPDWQNWVLPEEEGIKHIKYA